jgi:hypothetical protein
MKSTANLNNSNIIQQAFGNEKLKFEATIFAHEGDDILFPLNS